jgi:ATP-dependent DNA ligase
MGSVAASRAPPSEPEQHEGAREVLAKATIQSAKAGERDVGALAAAAFACKMGLEGIVSKRRESKYVSGRPKMWVR